MDDTSDLKRPRRSSVRMSLSAMNLSVEEKRSWLPPLVYPAHNPSTLAGLFLVNAAAVFWFFVLPVATQDGARLPYLMIFFFGSIPAAFLLGLGLIPLGSYLRYRRQTAAGVQAREFKESAAELVEIYNRNVFPEMGIDWGTYPDNSGHTDFAGCFRCHGAPLANSNGDGIKRDCSACHRILAPREQEPAILEQLGLSRRPHREPVPKLEEMRTTQ